MHDTRLFTGRLSGEEWFIVTAVDELDAGRYATAALGDVVPGTLREIPRTEGLGVAFVPAKGAYRATRFVPNLLAEGGIAADAPPPTP